MKPRLSIIGAGGHARAIADAARHSGRWQCIELFDDTFPRETLSGEWPIVGRIDDLATQAPDAARDPHRQIVVGSGDNHRRLELQETLREAGWRMATVLHPRAILSRGCVIGPGSVVLAGAIVNHGSHVGEACIINSGAIIEHDCTVDRAVHVSPGAILSGKVKVDQLSWIGAGSVVIQGRKIGTDSIIGAGSTVIDDVPDRVTVAGSPARLIKKRHSGHPRLVAQG